MTSAESFFAPCSSPREAVLWMQAHRTIWYQVPQEGDPKLLLVDDLTFIADRFYANVHEHGSHVVYEIDHGHMPKLLIPRYTFGYYPNPKSSDSQVAETKATPFPA